MGLRLAGYHPDWQSLDARPLGAGAAIPDRTWRPLREGPSDPREGGLARASRLDEYAHDEEAPAKPRRVSAREGTLCSYCRKPGHNRQTCKVLAEARRSGTAHLRPKPAEFGCRETGRIARKNPGP
jgi:hypothetical protein